MLANKLTTVDTSKSVAEIQQMLVKHGATQVMVEYEGADPVALAFKVRVNDISVSFRLPCNWSGVLKALRREVPPRLQTQSHALRVGWRVLREWLRAQLSLITAGSASMEEVMLPWAITHTGKTVYQELVSAAAEGRSNILMLPGPRAPDEAR